MDMLLARLNAAGVRLRAREGNLVISGNRDRLDALLLEELRSRKVALLEMLDGSEEWWTPPTRITPELLPLVTLSQDEIDQVTGAVPGGAANVQDIYPLAPLQEGILFHHILAADGDPYLMRSLYRFDTRERVDGYLAALNTVLARHDSLRTAILWEGLPEPVQVVCRTAPLVVEEVELDHTAGDLGEQLYAKFDPRRIRLDVRVAPLLRVHLARDARASAPDGTGPWLMLLLRHHLISDHITLEVLHEEVAALLLGRGDELPAPVPYRNFVAQARLGISRAEHEAFFRTLLGDVTEPTAPFGLLDEQGDAAGIAEAGKPVEPALGQRLRAVARTLGVSSATVCHVAFAQVLARASGKDDVVFGTVVFGRMHAGAGAERALGLYINTLPVRFAVGELGVAASVRRMQELLGDVLRHEHAPLALALRCSGVQAPTPLFAGLLNFRHAGGTRAAGMRQAWVGIRSLAAEERTNFPLTLSVNDWGDRFELTAQTETAVVTPERVCALMHTALERLVAALESAPATPVGRLDILPLAERHLVVDDWNATEAPYPREACVHELIEAQVARTPDAVAVVSAGGSLTYAELDARATRLAAHLRTLGVGPEARVAVCLERSAELVVALLAVLKAGGAYVPLDPSYPAERLRFMLADSRAVLVLTDGLRPHLPVEHDIPVLDLTTTAWGEETARAGDYSCQRLSPRHPMYVIYTSGSTGRPKGVVNEHAGVVNRLLWMQERYLLTAADAVLQKTPVSFDVSVWELFWPLLTGATLVMARPEGHKDPEYLATLIRTAGITTVHFVPSMLLAFLEHSAAVTCTGLRRVVCSGEALSAVLVQRAREILPQAVLHNLYGPTEAAIDVTYWQSPPADVPTPNRIPIGRPVANTTCFVLDRWGAPTPIGVAGELHIGGVQVARGYLNRAALTAERFIPDPFGAPGSRLYSTGDLAQWRTDGMLEYLGRNDHQVKVRGFRIELGEIEAALLGHPAVCEAAAIALTDKAGDPRLVAYYVLVPTASATRDGEPSAAALQGYLGERLPSYMVPAAYVHLGTMPLTPNGKLDRKALPAPEDGAFASRGYEAPVGAAEEAVAAIWGELLGVKRVGRHDDFFALGGHSLLAVRLVERMRRQDLNADIRTLFASPTLAALAETAGTSMAATEVEVPPNRIPTGCTTITPDLLPLVDLTQEEIDFVVHRVPDGAANVQDIYPLAPLQEGILFHHLMATDEDPYLLSAVFSFDARARVDAYLEALQRIIDRHDILRTAIVWEGLPDPVQVVCRHATLTVEWVTLPASGDPTQELYRHSERARLHTNLEQPPLLWIYVARDPHSQDWLLLLVMHHLIGDHTSVDTLHREIEAFWMQKEDERPTPVPFRNHIAQARLGVSEAEHERFFRSLLGDVTEPTAPFGLLERFEVGASPIGQLADARLPVDKKLARELRAQGTALGVSVASLCHVAWAWVLARLTERTDVVFGTVLFGRMQGGDGADRALGVFINTLPFRLHVDKDQQPVAQVRRAQALLGDLLWHEHAPLALAQRCSGVKAPTPLFSSLLNYRHGGGAGPAARPLWAGIKRLHGEEWSSYPLTLSVDDWGERFELTVLVSAPVDAEHVCRLMHSALERLVESMGRRA